MRGVPGKAGLEGGDRQTADPDGIGPVVLLQLAEKVVPPQALREGGGIYFPGPCGRSESYSYLCPGTGTPRGDAARMPGSAILRPREGPTVPAAGTARKRKTMYEELRTTVEKAWEERERLRDAATQQAVRDVIGLVDKGLLRTAEPVDPEKSEWRVNEWVKKAVILYFPMQPMRRMEAGELEWYDKMELKHGYEELGVRAVPHAVARYGAYIAPGAILMPSYVNIGAYVDTGTMVDTWATVGSCAQIGRHVHLSGGAGIGGVLEPVQAAPVIVEDNCFIGSRSIVVEGAHICREAVLGSNTVITGSTHIIDVTGPEPVTYKGYVPARSVVVPGSYRKQFPAGEYSVSCALIIGRRKESTDKKTSLNDALRDFGVPV